MLHAVRYDTFRQTCPDARHQDQLSGGATVDIKGQPPSEHPTRPHAVVLHVTCRIVSCVPGWAEDHPIAGVGERARPWRQFGGATKTGSIVFWHQFDGSSADGLYERRPMGPRRRQRLGTGEAGGAYGNQGKALSQTRASRR